MQATDLRETFRICARVEETHSPFRLHLRHHTFVVDVIIFVVAAAC